MSNPHEQHFTPGVIDERGALTDDLIETAHSEDFLHDQGLRHIAGDVIVAHGREMPLAEAIAKCDPLRGIIEGARKGLESIGVTDQKQVESLVKVQLHTTAANASKSVTTEAEKK